MGEDLMVRKVRFGWLARSYFENSPSWPRIPVDAFGFTKTQAIRRSLRGLNYRRKQRRIEAERIARKAETANGWRVEQRRDG